MTCEHAEELREHYANFPYGHNFCGNEDPHAPHDACLGIMCDYGCNADDF